MTNYVLIYTNGSAGGQMPESKEEQDALMADWMAWYQKLGEAIVDGGNPFNAAKNVTAAGVGDGGFGSIGATGYTIISADSLDDAVAKVQDHPQVKSGGEISIYQTFSMM